MELAAAHLAQMEHPQRQLVLISDFRRRDWTDVDAAARARLAARLEQTAPRPIVTLLKVDRPLGENVSVDSLEWPPTAIGVGQEIAVRALVRNHGSRRYGTAPARRVSHRRRRAGSRRTTRWVPSSALRVTFRCKFDKPGSHWVEVAIPDDALLADNVYRGAISVLQVIPVLLVDGGPDPRPLASETAFLELALRPLPGRG